MTGINVYISIGAAVLYVLVLVSIPFRIKKYGRREKGDNEKLFWIREIAIFILSAVIIGLCAFLDFGTVGDVVICGCGVLGAYSATKMLLTQ